ncbi:MAG: PIN domain-containing protein [Bacteroidota bacterium]
MNDKIFWDTNILVYYATDTGQKLKILQSELVKPVSHVLSVQVLNEYSNVALRKLGFTAQDIKSQLNGFTSIFEIVLLSPSITQQALDIKGRWGYSFYDCLIIAAALEGDCTLLYSEDLHDGQIINSLTIKNPFGIYSLSGD